MVSYTYNSYIAPCLFSGVRPYFFPVIVAYMLVYKNNIDCLSFECAFDIIFTANKNLKNHWNSNTSNLV